ncbi:hypothetical protein ABFS82_01G109900 [Erythranthe guttata]|nr:PREDICTED: plastid lipid-associated protein 3, chloroplastic [Erythranthe guttata]|eukprot:XP_012827538.1 PREDICTED: plastid lipid-associated protein 3, chloroplastic [Erythranthe guttata]
MSSVLVNSHPWSATAVLLSQRYQNLSPKSASLSFSPPNPNFSFSIRCSPSSSFNDPTDPPSKPDNEILPVPDLEPTSKFDDEWGQSEVVEFINGTPVPDPVVKEEEEKEDDGKLWELKRALVDTVYGSDFGFRASAEVRAETLELVSQLEAANPTPAPTESPQLLDGNWFLLYTASSELLPLLAAGSIPLVKVEKIVQSIDTSSLTIDNSVTLSSPVSTLSFSASASFEVRTPSRIQVEFKQGTFKPPEIKSSIDLPESINIFGQNISLSSVQQYMSPLENAVEGLARTISGQPSLKIPIPGEGTKSWLLTTYLDKDFRISRGDGGLFVLVKEGSPLLDM